MTISSPRLQVKSENRTISTNWFVTVIFVRAYFCMLVFLSVLLTPCCGQQQLDRKKLMREMVILTRDNMEKEIQIFDESGQIEPVYYVHTLILLSSNYEILDQPDKAERALNKAIAVSESKLGKGDLTRIKAMEALAHFKLRRGQLKESERLFQEALEHLKSVANSSVMQSKQLAGLGDIYLYQSKYDQAKHFYKVALDCATKDTADGLPDALYLSKLADVCRRERKYADSDRFFQPALRTAEKLLQLNPLDGRVIPVLKGYAELMHEMGRDLEAKRLEAKASEIKQRAENIALSAFVGFKQMSQGKDLSPKVPQQP